MTRRVQRPVYVAAIVERHDNHLLIALARGPDETARRWHFPRGRTNPGETPEAALRRVARDQLGIYVEIVVGQPPIPACVDGQEAEVRYFFCGVADGDVRRGSFADIAWIPRIHLREYDFDAVSTPVVEWLLDARS